MTSQPNRHLHHFNRGLAIGFEIIGLCGIAFLIGWGALIVRLSHGPMKVDFLTRRIEAAFNADQQDFKVSVGDTLLAWGGRGRPFMFEMTHVQIARADGTPLLAVKKIGVRLSKRHLLFGQLVPRVIRIYSPALRVVRNENGDMTLNMGNADADSPAADSEKTPAKASPPSLTAGENAGAADVLKALLARMKEDSRASLLGGLDEISITDAALLYQDKILGASWKSNSADIDFKRGDGSLVVAADAGIGAAPGTVTMLRATAIYNWNSRRTATAVSFEHLDPARLAEKSAALKELSGVNMPLDGRLLMTLDKNFRPDAGRFSVAAQTGKLTLPSFFPKPVAVKDMQLDGQFDIPKGEVKIGKARARFDGSDITATATLDSTATAQTLEIDASLKGMPIDRLGSDWPTGVAADARGWVTAHLSRGTATAATLHLTLAAPSLVCRTAAASLWRHFGSPDVTHVGGHIDFNGITVDYFPPLMPVTNVKGRATYDDKSFNLAIAGGALGDMNVTQAKIAIRGLDTATAAHPAGIEIAAGLKGPLPTALTLLSGKPLGYPQKLGLNAAGAAGDVSIDVNFKFPLYEKLQLADVNVGATATVDNVLLKNVAAGLPLSGGPVKLKLGKGMLTASGTGALGTMPVTFDWTKNFSAAAPFDSRIKADLPLTAAALHTFGVPAALNVTGIVPATIVYTVKTPHKASLQFKGDLAAAGFTVPETGYTKAPETPGTVSLSANFKNGALADIEGLDLETDKTVIKGGFSLAPNGTIVSAMLPQVKIGKTNVAVAVDFSKGAYDVTLTGASLDASPVLSDGTGMNNAVVNDAVIVHKRPPINLSMTVDRLITGSDGEIDGLTLALRRNAWGRIDKVTASGRAGNAPLTVSYLPVAAGHSLRVEADNAGAALHALGIADGVRGGHLVVSGAPVKNAPGGRDMSGTAYLMDFTLGHAPVLGRLLNALSLKGFIELLDGKGIDFKKMRCDFLWTDRGAPAAPKNVRRLTIRNGETSGASLGLTFKGEIDDWDGTVDMSGTIIPVSDLNKMLSGIPLVGNILTGGKGVFAATYTIKGPKADPRVTVNPLSVLAPGILRKLFFEK